MSRRLLVEADGGSRGNPGPAGYGAVVRDAESGEVLAERFAGIGRASNNVAEYRGLIAGLEACLELHRDDPVIDVTVRMDSKLVVEQMSGRWKVKHPDMKPLASQAAALVRQLPPVTFGWIPRERNGAADALANQAMDAQAALGTPTEPTEPTGSLAPPAPTAPPSPRTALPAGALKGFDADLTRPTTMLWARHGQTAHSAARLFSGSSDPELTALGERQAAALAGRLRAEGADGVEVVLCSPLRRARRTAEVAAAALGLTVTVDDRLRETHFGRWEVLSFAEVQHRDPEHLARWLADPNLAPPGGESFAATEVRVREVVAEVSAAHAGRTVLLVSHVTPIKTALRLALAAPPATLHRLHLDLCSVSTVRLWADGHAVLAGANDHAHCLGL